MKQYKISAIAPVVWKKIKAVRPTKMEYIETRRGKLKNLFIYLFLNKIILKKNKNYSESTLRAIIRGDAFVPFILY